MKENKEKFYNIIDNKDTSADIYIYGRIASTKWYEEETTALSFKEELLALENIQTLNVHINSYGGEVFNGLAIYNLLRQYDATVNVYIDGIAASIASVIAMAGDNIYMPKTASMMIHNCISWEYGNAKQLRKTAEDMDKIMEALKAAYLARINISEEKLQEFLDEETYLTAEECLEYGFITEIIDKQEKKEDSMLDSLCVHNLVMKLKEKQLEEQKKKENTIAISDEQIEKIIHGIKEQKQDENKQKHNQKQGSLVESIFNKFIND